MRRGLTLIEVVIALAILAIAASIIYPNVFRPKATAGPVSETALLTQTKAFAVARAEPVRLTVQQDGAWEIVTDGSPSSVLASGRLAEAPASAFEVRVTELGACLPGPKDKANEGPEIDAVSCTVRP